MRITRKTLSVVYIPLSLSPPGCHVVDAALLSLSSLILSGKIFWFVVIVLHY